MNKIGIFTFYNAQNYGATLQAYALQEKIVSLGYDAEHIRFFDKIYDQPASPFVYKVKRIISISGGHFLKYKKTKEIARKTRFLFESFRKEYIHTSREAYYSIEDLTECNHLYSGFVTGSDMVWSDIGQDLEVYFLTFSDYNKRIAYAPSITGTDTYSDSKNSEMKRLINGISQLSVREKTGVEYIKRITGRNSFWALDPAFLFSREEWARKLSLTIKKDKPGYILVYMFDGSKQYSRQISEFANKYNLKIRYVPMNVEERFEEISHGRQGVYGPKEFVDLFLNASFVITNSFHGLVFSLISQVPFALVHRGQGNKWHEHESRMSSLLELFSIPERYIDAKNGIPSSFINLDYSNINPLLNHKIDESVLFLNNALNSLPIQCNVQNNYRTIAQLDKKKCTGCTACANVCPQNAIKMEMDNEGFLSPQISIDKCVGCSLCVKHCHAINSPEFNLPYLTYGGYYNDIGRNDSASGGIFLSLAEQIISEGGVVIGACLDSSSFECKHIIVDNRKDLRKLQNSKYVQSNLSDIYSITKKILENDKRMVLFSGTPCQIAGLKSYLGYKKYGQLYTVDLVCHGVPSPLFWKWNVNRLQKKQSYFDSITFRNKEEENKSRSRFQMSLISNGVVKSHYSVREDPYYNSFMECKSYRNSCYYCKYAKPNRCSDITLGDLDSWREYTTFHPEVAKSTILINTDQGGHLFDKIKDRIMFVKIDYDKECEINHQLSYPSIRPQSRDTIYVDLHELNERDFVKKYAPAYNFKERTKRAIKQLIRR